MQTGSQHRGNTVAAGAGVVVAAGILIVLAVLFGGGFGGGAGDGEGPEALPRDSATPAEQSPESAQPQRPLRVRIEESSYLVNGQSLDLPALLELAAKVPAGDGPAIQIERAASSRAKAETDLREALDRESITYTSD